MATLFSLGFVVPDLGPTQLSFWLIKNANAFLQNHPNASVLAFYENRYPPCIELNFASMHIYEAWGFSGSVVATSLSTAAKVLRFPASPKRCFYVWDLEWLRLPTKDYHRLAAIYRHPDLDLIARSDEHARAIERAWNRPVAGVMPDFNLESVYEVAWPETKSSVPNVTAPAASS